VSREFDPVFSAALRVELERRVTGGLPHRWRGPRTLLAAVILMGIAGAGAATAAVAGYLVLPGAPSVSKLGASIMQEGRGSASIDLGAPPRGATNIAIEFACLGSGQFVLGDGSAISCGVTDIGSITSATLPLATSQHTTTVTTDDSAAWRISAAYVNSETTPWAVNTHGQTYGAANSHGSPDLIAVQTTTGKDGYALATDLEAADGTTAVKSFKSPQDALDWQRKMAGKTIVVAVYLSDGTTRVGDFRITYPPA